MQYPCTLVPGLNLRYTTDESEPNESSTLYIGAFDLTSSAVVRTKAFAPGRSPSGTAVAEARFKASPPEFNRPDGYGEPLPYEIEVSSETPAPFDIWFTFNGGNPSTNQPGSVKVTSGKIQVTSSGVYRFAVFKDGWVNGTVVERTFNITGGDLTFEPFSPDGTNGFVSDRPIEVTITSPNQDPNLRIRVVTEGDPSDSENTNAVVIANGGKVLITKAQTTLKAIAFGPGIAGAIKKEGVYQNVNPVARLGEALVIPPGAALNPPPVIPLHRMTNVVGGVTNVSAFQRVAFVADAGTSGQVYAVARGFEPIVEWYFPQYDTNIQFQQTIEEPAADAVVTLYQTEDTPPQINQQLVVNLKGVPDSIIHYQDDDIIGLGTGRVIGASTNLPHVWIDLTSGVPLLRAKPPRTGLFVIELRDAPAGSPTPGFKGMQVVRVKPYLPDANAALVQLGSELQPENLHEGHDGTTADGTKVIPNVTAGSERNTLNGHIYQHERTGQATHGRVFAIRRNELLHQMEVVWRHLDRSGRVIWPYEIRRYTARWPHQMQLYVRGDRPHPLGPRVAIPTELRPTVVPSQEPFGHAGFTMTDTGPEFSSELPPLTSEGLCLVFLDLERDATGVNWIGFEAVRSVRNTDTNYFDLSLTPWEIGSEVLDPDSLTFSVGEFGDLPSLASKLKQPGRPFDIWIAAQLSPASKAVLENYPDRDPNSAQLQQTLLEDFNILLGDASIYEHDRFAGIILRPETQALLSKNPKESDLRLLNRFLIEDAYSLEISKKPSGYPPYLPGYIQVPFGRMLEGKPADRYAAHIYGQFRANYLATEARTTGQIFGVNEGNLEVWWFNVRTNAAWLPGDMIQWPSWVQRYQFRWPGAPTEIVLAKQSTNSPPHNVDPELHYNSSIYYENSPNSVGYNPNEEHAFIENAVLALRDDLGTDATSKPYVIHQFQTTADIAARWVMRVFHVGTGDPTHPLTAGIRLQPPTPLDRFFETQELGVSGPYWADRKSQYWAKAAGDDGGTARAVMRYWYPAQVSNYGFLVPGNPGLQHGDPLPWQNVRAQQLGQNSTPDQPLNVNFDVRWPDNPPILQFGETLVKPKRGLPEILGQKSVEVLYEQQRPPGGLVRLIDPVAGYSIPLTEAEVKGNGSVRLIELPTRYYFEDAPPYLQRRVYYDRSRNLLRFVGAFLEGSAGGFGEDYLQLNVLSARDLQALSAAAVRAGGARLRSAFATLAEMAREVRPIRSQEQAFELQALTAGFATGSGYVTLAFQNNTNTTSPDDDIELAVIKVGAPLYTGEIKVIYPASPFDEKLTLRHTGDFAGKWEEYEFEWRTLPASIDPGYRENPATWALRGITNAPAVLPTEWRRVATEPASGRGAVDYTIQGASLLTLSDNWFICRYRPVNASHPMVGQWSEWTRPELAEGWIKRVLRGNDLSNLGLATQLEDQFRSYQTSSNRTLSTVIGLAGKAYEGDIALNINSAREAGLIQIYETVLRRGMSLSIEATKDYDPANTALLLAASRLAQLYGLLGGEAYADAVDPTLTFDNISVGAFSSSVHAFQNQTAGINSLLQEELALLRGRADPGVRPFYNRLPPNFTGGPGEAAYVLNYSVGNLQPGEGLTAASAALLYPQGHGDAWGHYLSGLKVYYRLLRHPYFTWVPRSEVINLVGDGQSAINVEVDYQDERRFAELAAAKARTGLDLINLTYRDRYTENPDGQWQGYRDEMPNQAWGVSEWASRAGQGALIDWAVGTSLLPDEDNNPAHIRDIQKVERGRIRELGEIAAAFRQIQLQLDQADAGLNPLGLAPNAIPFDLDPNISPAQGGATHYEQMAARAKTALRNASQVFAVSQGAAGLLREQFDVVDKFSQQVNNQEIDYKNQLISIFGYPYPDDTGRNPGGIYEESYVNDGPDLYHFMLVDPSRIPGLNRGGEQEMTVDMLANQLVRFADGNSQVKNIKYYMSTEGFGMVKPKSWKGERRAPGEIQMAMSDLFQAYGRFLGAAREYDNLIEQIEDQRRVVAAQAALNSAERSSLETEIFILRGANQEQATLNSMIAEARAQQVRFQNKAAFANIIGTALAEAFQFRSGNIGPFPFFDLDITAVIRSAIRTTFSVKGQEASEDAAKQGLEELSYQQAKETVQSESSLQIRIAQRGLTIARGNLALESARAQLNQLVRSEATRRLEMFNLQEAMQQASGRYLMALDRGVRLLQEVDRFRAQTAAEVQKYRYKDLIFRIYRNEGIQKYRSQFDVAGRYTYLTAKAYDYETALLPADPDSGQKVLADIVRARSLGLVGTDGEPVSTPATGDPGLAGVLGRMASDWESVKTRFGIGNPDSTTLPFSLRRELFRQATAGQSWRDVLQSYRVANVLDDPVYRRYCIPSHDPSSTREPALVIPFATTIQDGLNFFGRVKGPGDAGYSTAYWATKIRSVGVELVGYNSALFPRTPRVYLVPAGIDLMRVPGHGDRIREFYVLDQVLPLPSALTGGIIGAPGFIPIVDSISQPQSFAAIRQIPDFLAFYAGDGFNEATKSNRRLVGRSVWNTQWVLILRGRELNGADPDRGLDDLILGPEVNGVRTGALGLSDIQLRLESDSAAGN